MPVIVNLMSNKMVPITKNIVQFNGSGSKVPVMLQQQEKKVSKQEDVMEEFDDLAQEPREARETQPREQFGEGMGRKKLNRFISLKI